MNYKTSTLTAFAAAPFNCALFAMAASSSANAADYCITNGAQAADGCGFPTMAAYRAASAGIGGACSPNGVSGANNPRASMSFHPNQSQSQVRRRARPVLSGGHGAGAYYW
jgi:hypothetical protein